MLGPLDVFHYRNRVFWEYDDQSVLTGQVQVLTVHFTLGRMLEKPTIPPGDSTLRILRTESGNSYLMPAAQVSVKTRTPPPSISLI